MEASRANDLRPGTECLPGECTVRQPGPSRNTPTTKSLYRSKSDVQKPPAAAVDADSLPADGRQTLHRNRAGGKCLGQTGSGSDFEKSPSEPPLNTGRAAGTRLSCVAPEAGPILRLVGIPEKSIVGPGPRAPATVRGPWSRPNAPNRPAMDSPTARLRAAATPPLKAAEPWWRSAERRRREASRRRSGVTDAISQLSVYGTARAIATVHEGPHRGLRLRGVPGGESLAPPRPLRRRRPSRSAAGAWQSPTQ